MTAQSDGGAAPAIEKPQIVAPEDKSTEGMITITTKEGDTVSALAKSHGISENTIRWVNGLGSADSLSAGTKLKILPVTGLLHTVKAGETVEGVAGIYNASPEQISAINDVELHGLRPGTEIIIPSGTKPAAPTPTPSTGATAPPSSSYAFGGSSPLFAGNRYAFGYCTWYAYNRRAALGRPVASNWGNASTWSVLAQSSGFGVNKTPLPGAVFQTGGGWGGYGHVGVVEDVHADGSITVSEMNYAGWNVVSSRKISAGQVGTYNYIH